MASSDKSVYMCSVYQLFFISLDMLSKVFKGKRKQGYTGGLCNKALTVIFNVTGLSLPFSVISLSLTHL